MRMRKLIITEEEKKNILGMYKSNDDKGDVQSQIDAEIERLGYDPEEVEVLMDEEPNQMNENVIKKAIIICSVVAGVVSCRKPDAKYVYQYSYETESSQEYSQEHGYDVRTTNFHTYDHKLSEEEEDSIQDRLDSEKTRNGEEILDSDFKLYAIDTEGEWG